MKFKLLISVFFLVLSTQSHAFFWGWFSSNTNYTKTKHPIILVQGIIAFDTIAGIDYWYKIPEKIEKEGGRVFIAKINAFDDSYKRGEQLIDQLDTLRALHPEIQKFNIVAHSQGGMTGRYVANVRPDLVASITTMGTPHKGAPIADLLTDKTPEDSPLGGLIDLVGNAAGNLINLLGDNPEAPSNLRGMLSDFNTEGSATFNQLFPVGVPTSDCGEGAYSANIGGHNLRFYSWAGTKTWTTGIDPSDWLFTTTGLVFQGAPNDGLTGRCSSHFGKVIKDNYKMNHIDLVNHLFGITHIFETSPLSVYREHAHRLKKAGL